LGCNNEVNKDWTFTIITFTLGIAKVGLGTMTLCASTNPIFLWAAPIAYQLITDGGNLHLMLYFNNFFIF